MCIVNLHNESFVLRPELQIYSFLKNRPETMLLPYLYLPFWISGMLLDLLPNTSVVQVLSVFCILVLCTQTLALL